MCHVVLLPQRGHVLVLANASPPKGGLVSVLVDSVMEGIVVLSVNPLMSTPMIGIVNDIYIVPVNISYDKVMIHIPCFLIILPY